MHRAVRKLKRACRCACVGACVYGSPIFQYTASGLCARQTVHAHTAPRACPHRSLHTLEQLYEFLSPHEEVTCVCYDTRASVVSERARGVEGVRECERMNE